MKLIREISTEVLAEEALESTTAEELWQSQGAGASTYVTTTTYFIKPDGNRFDVYYDENNARKFYGKIDKATLQSSFVPVRANQDADAEGFITYRDADEYDAFKYDGDPIKVDLGDKDSQVVKLMKGDYLLRQTDKDSFTYTIEKGRFFDNGYVKKS